MSSTNMKSQLPGIDQSLELKQRVYITGCVVGKEQEKIENKKKGQCQIIHKVFNNCCVQKV